VLFSLVGQQTPVRTETLPAETGEGAFIWHQLARIWLKFRSHCAQCGKNLVMESMDISNDMLLLFVDANSTVN
jgi:hypothetical protein